MFSLTKNSKHMKCSYESSYSLPPAQESRTAFLWWECSQYNTMVAKLETLHIPAEKKPKFSQEKRVYSYNFKLLVAPPKILHPFGIQMASGISAIRWHLLGWHCWREKWAMYQGLTGVGISQWEIRGHLLSPGLRTNFRHEASLYWLSGMMKMRGANKTTIVVLEVCHL